jgi:hypothetical protein
MSMSLGLRGKRFRIRSSRAALDPGREIVGTQIFEPGEPITIDGMVGMSGRAVSKPQRFREVYRSSLPFEVGEPLPHRGSAIPPAQLVTPVKAAIESPNSDRAVFGVLTMEEVIADSVTEPRFHGSSSALLRCSLWPLPGSQCDLLSGLATHQ